MPSNSDDTKPTIEDVDRMILDHERKSPTGRGMEQANEEHIAKGEATTKTVHIKKGESLWDRAAREVDAADEGEEKS